MSPWIVDCTSSGVSPARKFDAPCLSAAFETASITPLSNVPERIVTVIVSPLTPNDVAPPLSPPPHLKHGGA
jgi:hypothetical protein